MVKVFVYGTLRTGDCRHGVETFSKMIAPEAYLEGFKMLDLGGFPGLVRGEGCVRGEIHEYEDFTVLDRIEGYSEAAPETGLYNRVQVQAEVSKENGHLVKCWVYTFNQKQPLWTEETIPSGDWFEHRGYYEKSALSE